MVGPFSFGVAMRDLRNYHTVANDRVKLRAFIDDRCRREHYHCDDSHYCCGKCTHSDHIYTAEGIWREGEEYPLGDHNGYPPRRNGACNCGADAHNAKVEAILRETA